MCMVPCGGGNYFKSLVILLARTAKMLIASIFVVGGGGHGGGHGGGYGGGHGGGHGGGGRKG